MNNRYFRNLSIKQSALLATVPLAIIGLALGAIYSLLWISRSENVLEKINVEVEGEFPLRLTWTTRLEEQIRTSAAVGNHALAISGRYNLYAINMTDGTIRWSQPITPGVYPTVPIATHGVILAADRTRLIAFREEDGELLLSRAVSGEAEVLAGNDQFVVIKRMSDQIEVYGWPVGEELWNTQGGRGRSKAFIDGGKLIYEGGPGYRVRKIATGEILFGGDIGGRADTYDQGRLYYGDVRENRVNILVAYDFSQQAQVWERRLDSQIQFITVNDNSLYISTDSELYRLDLRSGTELWRVNLESSYYQKPLIMHQAIYLRNPSLNQILAISVDDGKMLGIVRFTPRTGFFMDTRTDIRSNGELLFCSFANHLFAFRGP